ncbi:endonuclease [Jatrophihabitans fulvus]
MKRDVEALLHENTTFAEAAGITLRDKPSPLFRLLVLTSLLSANLDARLGLRTAKALSKAGYTTAAKLAAASDEQRWQVLSDSKYLRKKQTARQLGSLADEVLDRYDGDLRALRDLDAKELREKLRDFTGIGGVGADIFVREVQAVWPGLRPFADKRVRSLAAARGLPKDPARLAKKLGTDDLSHLGAALIFADRSS